MKSVGIVFTAFAIALIFGSLNIPASGNIPSGPQKTEPKTVCGEYLATQSSDRIDQWIYTFQTGLVKNPELEQEVWICVMDIYKMSVTDQFMVRECRKNIDAPFEELAFKALTAHLEQCGISVHR